MKKINSILMILAAAAGFTNCSKADLVENKETGNGGAVVYATTDIVTKTTLANDYKVLWSSGDQINFVKNDAPANTYIFTLSSGEETTSGTFICSETPVDGTYTVYYPATYNDTYWPAQNYVSAADISGAPMKATATVSDGIVSDISFKNEGGILRYTVKGTKTIKSINVKSASPALDVTLDCGEGVAPATGGTVFNIALPAGEYSNATLKFIATDNTVATKTASSFIVTKNKISLATFDGLTFQASSTGTAKRTGDIDVRWVQLWADGPKFAEYNVGANSATDVGTTMTFTDATKTGADYVWGANWCTPSKDDMDELLLAAQGNSSSKVTCNFCEFTQGDGKWGFKFTGLTDGYTGNSVFFPAQGVRGSFGVAVYWSATANGSTAWFMNLVCNSGSWLSVWNSREQDYYYLVRPVLQN